MTPFYRETRNPAQGLFLVFALALLFLTEGQATIINVPADQATIQAGINVANTGDTVLVAPGYYQENITFQGKEITVSSRFLLDHDPAFIFNTTIDGSNPYNPDSASTVRIFCENTEAPVFQGFTVTGGGGTVMLDPTEGQYKRNGGGIAARLGAPVIRFNYIHHNQPNAAVSVAGGGIYLQMASAIIENNVIMSNPGRTGCGIAIRLAYATAHNNVIAFNSGGEIFGGAGIYLYEGQLDGYNNTVAFNNSVQPGGGVRVAAASINLQNSIVWGNTSASGSSPQTYVDPGYGGTISLEYSDIEGGYAGTGNINADPVFSGNWFFVSEGSPCVDSGDPNAALNDLPWPSTPTAARWPSRGGLQNDMGAYGGPGCYPFEMVTINASDIFGWAPWTVDFDAAESYFEADSWNWEFGDGETGSGQTAAHTYEEPGVHDVTVIVGHDEGETYEFTRQALVWVVADTTWVGDVECVGLAASTPIEVLIHARNAVPVDEIWIPVAYSGDLQLAYDGFTTVGCRTADLATQTEHFHNPVAKTMLFELKGTPGLAPGSGPVIKLLFHALTPANGQTATISLASELVGTDPQFQAACGPYRPVTIDGSFQWICCIGTTGNVNTAGIVDLADLSALVSYLTGGGYVLPCVPEANVNNAGIVDLADLSALVSYLTGGGYVLPNCG